MKLRSGRERFVCRMLVLCVSLVVIGAAPAQTQPVKQAPKLHPFSADQILTMLNKTTSAKFHFTPSAVRIEIVDGKGNKVIQIMRFDQNVMWNLIPWQKIYMELPGSSSEWASWAEEKEVQRESLGLEQLGEYHCEKFKVHRTVMGQASTSLEWDAKELDGLPVKMQDEKGTWSNEFTNVQLGPQDQSLFEIPAGYQKLSLAGLQKPSN